MIRDFGVRLFVVLRSGTGQIRPWYPIGMDGSLPLDSFRAVRTQATEGVGQ